MKLIQVEIDKLFPGFDGTSAVQGADFHYYNAPDHLGTLQISRMVTRIHSEAIPEMMTFREIPNQNVEGLVGLLDAYNETCRALKKKTSKTRVSKERKAVKEVDE